MEDNLVAENASREAVNSSTRSGQPSFFRSVLPHEPPLIEDEQPMGYLHIQGSFTPKLRQQPNEEEILDHCADDSSVVSDPEFWVGHRGTFETMLQAQFKALSPSSDHHPVQLKILDPAPPFTKVRLYFDSPSLARESMLLYRKLKLHPAQLLEATAPCPLGFVDKEASALRTLLLEKSVRSHRELQITEITSRPTSSCPSWTRSSPPKFRRLIARPDEEASAVEHERQTTRFVVITNLLPQQQQQQDDHPSSSSNSLIIRQWEGQDTPSIAQCIRSVVTRYDRSGFGVEVFVPSQSNKRSRYCHVGMRSAADAQAVVAALQEQVVDWPCCWITATTSTTTNTDANNKTATVQKSGKLFVDYAAVTQRSEARAAIRNAGGGGDGEKEAERLQRGGPQCTSTTDHIRIPGLVLIPDFVSGAEEAALMAVLTGPHAPWAPTQRTASHGNAVVRRAVQHYGYVFDYQTANVLRDRSRPGADCPPMPAVPGDELDDDDTTTNHHQQLLEDYIGECLDGGRGWEVLAGVIQRTRRFEFKDECVDDVVAAAISFPDLNQMTVNQYVKGEGIGSHVDTPSAFADGLISISLNGGIVMEFRNVDEKDATKGTKKLVYLPPRSLLLMSKDARYKWEHMIVSRMTDTHNGEVSARKLRLSLTLRTALSEDGESHLPLVQSAAFPPIWGDASRLFSASSSSSQLATPDCERDHVHAVYDAIATQWHHTRGKRGVLWPGATQFLQRLSPGSIVADVGCGDGKYFPAIWEAGSYVIGTDISEPLLRTATHDCNINEDDIPETRRVSEHRYHLRNRPAVAVADCMNVPLRTSSCDAAICIAVLHHLSTPERRKRCIEELVRIVKPGGLVNVQAWALEQEDGSRRKFASNDVFVPFNAQPKYLQMNSKLDAHGKGTLTRPNEADGDKSIAQVYSEALNAEYDDRKGLVVFKRYCHLYRRGELDQIALEVPGAALVESGFESGNYFIIFEVRK